MSWYLILLLIFSAVFLLRNEVEQRLRYLKVKEKAQNNYQRSFKSPSQIDQAMVLSIISSAIAAGVAPSLAINAGLSYLPNEQANRYLAELGEKEIKLKEDFLSKNLQFLLSSVDNGNQVAATLQNKIEIFQAKHKLQILTAIKKAEVWMLAPLGICFLPTFILLTIIPLLASMLGNFFN